jgi:hypothetical protein
VTQASRGRAVPSDQLARLGPLVLPETPAQQANRDRLEMMVQWGPKAQPVRPVIPARRVPLASRAHPAIRDLWVPQDQKAPKVLRALKAWRDRRANPERASQPE